LITEHVERLKPFLGTREEAEHLANLDADQFFIRKIKFYLGDPEPNKITSLEIVVEFEDEDVYFLQCDKDITETQCFIAYAEINRELFWLTIDSPLRRNYFKAINNTVVPKYVVGYTAYTKLRFWGFHWFEGLSLPKLMCTDDPEIPKDYVGLVFPRSSIRKYDLELTNSVGVIDSGYRGEIQLTFNKVNSKTTIYNVGDRIGQIMIIPYPKINFVESDELTITERGEGGFGSSGS
jgi:hypothetical protein